MSKQEQPSETERLQAILKELGAPTVTETKEIFEPQWILLPNPNSSRFGCCGCRDGCRSRYCSFCDQYGCDICVDYCRSKTIEGLYNRACHIRERIIDMLEQEENEKEDNDVEAEEVEENEAKRSREDRAAYWNELREDWDIWDEYKSCGFGGKDGLAEWLRSQIIGEISERLSVLESEEEARGKAYWTTKQFLEVEEYVAKVRARLNSS
eukprot:TRINITY_DN205_c0_g1_i1.p1 TRINITY_DN205_c0_g1~~TRINITY_DN205_c0_g1_i1.p1  ORF type:complete len:210 (-),score=18.98 TRINITY_DN205_c0_g1_i1:169-798(-)